MPPAPQPRRASLVPFNAALAHLAGGRPPDAIADPVLAAAGFAATPGVAPKPTEEEAIRRKTPITDLLPTFMRELKSSYMAFDVPDNAAGINGMAYWYPLIDVQVGGAIFPSDVYLFSANIDQLACDVAGDSGNSVLAWGTLRGRRAAIVIGDNLPIGGATDWVFAPCSLSGLNKGSDAAVLNSNTYIYSTYFPSGDFRAVAGAPSRTILKAWQPFVYRFQPGTRIQAALVVNSAALDTVAGELRTLACEGSVGLNVAPVTANTSFNRL